MTATEREPMAELLNRGSLGAPAAKAGRARTSDEQVRKVLDRVAQLEAERASLPVLSGLFCCDEHPITGAMCRLFRDECAGAHDFEGLPDWAEPTETEINDGP